MESPPHPAFGHPLPQGEGKGRQCLRSFGPSNCGEPDRESCLPHHLLDLRRRGYGLRGPLLNRVGCLPPRSVEGQPTGGRGVSQMGPGPGPEVAAVQGSPRSLGRCGGGRSGAAKPQPAVRGDGRAVGARFDPLQAVDDRSGNLTGPGSAGRPGPPQHPGRRRRGDRRGVAPIFFVWFKRNARSEKLLSQLSDAFDLMSRVIRAGQTMSQGLQAVADEFSPPVATEFAFCFEQQNMGLAPETALRELARRTGLLELKIFVLAVLIQQQTGGNLAELLDKLSHIIRERYKLRGKIQALTAEGRMQAMVLLGLPPGLFLLMLVMNRSYAGTLLEHPSLIWTTVISETIGGLWIRKIVNFDF